MTLFALRINFNKINNYEYVTNRQSIKINNLKSNCSVIINEAENLKQAILRQIFV